MNSVVEMPTRGLVQNAGRMSVAEVTQHAIAVQEVMKAVMKKDVHYGVIPFTDKPTLYKAGAEVLCMTFRIADEYKIEDLSSTDAIRYRVSCVGRHQVTGVELGSGMGEGSTGEEKYRWRKAVCPQEFDATPPTLRRTKFAKGKAGSFYTTDQVRTEPSDLANTVLKMACKRAKMAMVLNVLAASDCFTQDLEDLDDTLRQHLADEDGHGTKPEHPALPEYAAADFEKNLPEWQKKLIDTGKKTPADLLAMLSTRATFSEEQKKRLLALKKAEPPADKPDVDPFVLEMEAAEGTQQ